MASDENLSICSDSDCDHLRVSSLGSDCEDGCDRDRDQLTVDVGCDEMTRDSDQLTVDEGGDEMIRDGDQPIVDGCDRDEMSCDRDREEMRRDRDRDAKQINLSLHPLHALSINLLQTILQSHSAHLTAQGHRRRYEH